MRTLSTSKAIPKLKKFLSSVSMKSPKKSYFGQFCLFFEANFENESLFQKNGSVTFLPFSLPDFMQKIRKICWMVNEIFRPWLLTNILNNATHCNVINDLAQRKLCSILIHTMSKEHFMIH